MQLTNKAIGSPLGIRVLFDVAPVSRFHVDVSLPDPADPYRMTAKITMPEDREDLWLEGANAALRRMQNANRWTVRLDYRNAIRFFDMSQLQCMDKRNPAFSMHLYNVPEDELDIKQKPVVSLVSASEFKRMYNRARREAGK